MRQRDLTDALEKVQLGTARNVVIPAEERRRTAYHEAGHALHRHAPARRRSRAQGLDRAARPRAWRHACPLRSRIATATTPTTCAAGSSARWEGWRRSRRCSASSRRDRRAISRWSPAWRDRWSGAGACPSASAGCRCCRRTGIRGWPACPTACSTRVDEEVRRITDECYAEARRLLRENRDKLDAIVGALLEHESLDEPEIYAAAGITRLAEPLVPAHPPRGNSLVLIPGSGPGPSLVLGPSLAFLVLGSGRTRHADVMARARDHDHGTKHGPGTKAQGPGTCG